MICTAFVAVFCDNGMDFSVTFFHNCSSTFPIKFEKIQML